MSGYDTLRHSDDTRGVASMTTVPPLPDAFCRQMENWLGGEWPQLQQALQSDVSLRGIRLHRWENPTTASYLTSKDLVQRATTDQPFTEPNFRVTACPLLAVEDRLPLPDKLFSRLTSPVPWTHDGYYVPSDTDLGKTIYHEAGAFYMQEPSAMAVVEALNPMPGETILDLCAAPGGKTTAIGARMRGQGVLVANEIHPERVIVLSQNLERTGVPAVVVNETSLRLAEIWTQQFDGILVDAPCSGEGMFRKEPESRSEWTEESPKRCARRQQEILANAVRMVKPGGRLVYSTCTLNPVENEQVVSWAVENLPLELEPLPFWPGWSEGRAQWVQPEESKGSASTSIGIHGTRRLWPHIADGEGHFVARFRVTSEWTSEGPYRPKTKSGKNQSNETSAKEGIKAWLELAEQLVHDVPDTWRRPIVRGNLLFAPLTSLPLTGLKVLRPGLPLGEMNGRVVVPHHALAMALDTKAAQRTVLVSGEEAARFLSGEALPYSLDRGWHQVNTNGLPLGWGKAAPGRLNNNYPKGLRKTKLVCYT